jgi:hypothetical protein
MQIFIHGKPYTPANILCSSLFGIKYITLNSALSNYYSKYLIILLHEHPSCKIWPASNAVTVVNVKTGVNVAPLHEISIDNF